MMNKLITILIAVVFVAGLVIAAYPKVSSFISAKKQADVVDGYHENIDSLDEESKLAQWAAAEDYNRQLRDSGLTFDSDDDKSSYSMLLNLDGTGVMGTIVIPKIDCTLPIYHGTEESVLRLGVGHMEGSSLPIGGEGSHCILSGHRGLPTSELFTYLDELEIGDRFYINVLGETLEYEIDDIAVVLPEETQKLAIVDGEDLCTLVTCTPYGINTHRLLVRGSRVK